MVQVWASYLVSNVNFQNSICQFFHGFWGHHSSIRSVARCDFLCTGVITRLCTFEICNQIPKRRTTRLYGEDTRFPGKNLIFGWFWIPGSFGQFFNFFKFEAQTRYLDIIRPPESYSAKINCPSREIHLLHSTNSLVPVMVEISIPCSGDKVICVYSVYIPS